MRRKTPFGLLGSRYFSHRGVSGHRDWDYNNAKKIRAIITIHYTFEVRRICENMHILQNNAYIK